tara:strand:- start:199 stop:384 length:186 start_codon:yes stop_codon:yes gene_type:complete
MKRDKDDSLKNLECLLEKLLDELIVETTDLSMPSDTLPIPTRTFLEMEAIVGEKINLIGLS